MRKPLAYWTRRYSHDQTIPPVVNHAHLAMLTNRQAGSGGDMLPMEFQMQGLGPVIGTRTWGGLVGVSMFIRMIDGGGLTAPDYRIYDPRGALDRGERRRDAGHRGRPGRRPRWPAATTRSWRRRSTTF